MSRRTRPSRKASRPQRQRIFLGCEGASEEGYAARLQSLIDLRALPIALDIAVLTPGAGDPHELVRKAAAKAAASAQRRGEHASRYLLLDLDRHDPTSDLGRRTLDLARRHEIVLVWQDPCHEALLLRHLPGCRDRRPSTSAEAAAALKRAWPAYEKPMSRLRLTPAIDEPAVLRATEVEPGLRALMLATGLLRDARAKTRKGP